ncbi:DNA-binding PucR family transcriptional regulator [Amycolatopsis echigonensis]|uniref:DNA-binding PucR family transcriptional regulator n=1 Tax=Amycolatopsis echigonensis TaxID=2576905 RepID=A0A2N3WAS9_9PSEU|nr:helix-turn-helix domain-containing protein [Amycolatopsis niigatensis]PKV90975.1 DNA-binding PucR family transcriptional regulator [Amycolatopsis niigatensis]
MVTLDRLVNVLGGYGARLCCCPVAREAALRDVVMDDPADPRGLRGDVYLAVGVESVLEAIERATAARASVVLVRGATPPGPEEVAQAENGPVAVLLVDPEVSWGQLAGVVYGLVLEGRETESGRGPTDLFALADSLADALGSAVTIEDQLSRVLAYSSRQQGADRVRLETILGRRVPDQVRDLFERRGVFAHLAVSDEPLFVEPDPEHGLTGRMVVAVRAGRETLGSIWVECEEPLSDVRRTVLHDSSRTVGLHLLRSRASADLERQVESDLVIRLLEGTPDAAAVLSRLGLPPGRFRVVALQAHIADERHAALLLAFERATTGFGWSRPGRSTLFSNTVYTVLPGEDVETARAWIDGIRDALPAQVTVAAGIGAPASTADLPASRRESDECLALHDVRPKPGATVAYDESWDDILILRLRAAAAAGRAPARGPIADLARHDAAHSTSYVATLRAWLETQGDLTEAAERLGVHPNTIRYRLRKMADVTPLRLDLPAKRLAMIIELAVADPQD